MWRALRAIPYGETASYGEVATAVGQPGAARAVGGANNRNPIAIVVPCHRVIGASGSLTGYGGGLPRKQQLLALEAGARRSRRGWRSRPSQAASRASRSPVKGHISPACPVT